MRRLAMVELGRMEMSDVSAPEECAPGHVRLRVLRTAVGLFQIQMLRGMLDTGGLPRVLGHEIIGQVLDHGDGISTPERGSIVVVDPVIGCGACPRCIEGRENLCPGMRHLGIDVDGGFGDNVTVPVQQAFGLPADVALDEAVMLASALPTAIHVVRRSELEPGSCVTVAGVGSIGFLVCQVARAFGASRVIAADIKRSRLEMVAPYVDAVVEVPHEPGVAGYEASNNEMTDIDIVFETAGVRANIDYTMRIVRPGGTAVLVGIAEGKQAIRFDDYLTQFIRREITIRSTFGYTRTDFVVGNSLYQAGRLDLRPTTKDPIGLDEIPTTADGILELLAKRNRQVVTVQEPVGK